MFSRKFVLFSAFLFLAGTASCLHAQAGDPAAIQQKLFTQFKLTTITADRSDIVAAGDVVVIHKPGLIMYAVASPMPPSNTYKNGKISQGWGGFGKDMMITMAAPGGATATDYPHRPFVPDERCWVTGLQVQKDGVLFQLYSDPYDSVRYYAILKIPFPNKKEVPSIDTAMQLVAEVLTVVPSDQAAPDQGNQGGQPASMPTAAAPSQDPLMSVEGTYFRKDHPSDTMELESNGVFALVQNGRRFDGNYTIQGEILTVWGPKIVGHQRCSLVGNVITDPGKTIWEKPVTPQNVAVAPGASSAPAAVGPASAPAPAPVPLADIPPPPPPTDAPPPTIALGQTMDQVTTAFGQPLKVARLGAKVIFYFKDMKVTFTNGKVSNVE
jgi:hypothetical protein